MAIKTAKDILEENEESQDKVQHHSRREEERDQVDEAYESISKKLESLRRGEKPEEEAEEPKEAEEPEEEEKEAEETEEKEEKKEELEDSDEEEDPLDREDSDEKADEEEEKDPIDELDEEESSDEPKPTPDTLDDLVESETPAKEPTSSHEEAEEESQEERPVRRSFSDMNEDSPTELNIPNLRSNSSIENPNFVKPQHHLEDEFGPQDPDKFFNRHATSTPRRGSNKWHLIILILIGLTVIGATVYLLKGQFKDFNASPSPSPVTSATPAPTPSPSPQPERRNFKIRVLNGTGKTGLAKTVADKLKDLGYQQDKTGNATSSAIPQTTIRTKSSSASASAQLVKDLAPDYDAQTQTNLKDNDPADFEIILGLK